MQVCARCCLRFAGVRSVVYSQRAPSTQSLCAAFEARTRTTKSEPQEPFKKLSAPIQNGLVPTTLIEKESRTGQGLPKTVNDEEHDPQNSPARAVPDSEELVPFELNVASTLSPMNVPGVEDPKLAVEDYEGQTASAPPCRVCLGILQSLDGPVAAIPPNAAELLPDADACGARCEPLSTGTMAAVADHIKWALIASQ